MTDLTKPTDLDGRVWAESGVITSPDTLDILDGWDVGEKPPAQFFNYWQNRTDKILTYLNQKGIPEWDINTGYIASKSFVTQSGSIYIAKLSHTGQSPALDVTFVYWGLLIDSTGAIPASSQAFLLARANHTGTQAQSSIVNLVSDLAAKEALTNKVTSFASPDNTTYPTTLAVATLVAGGSAGGILKTEPAANVINSTQTLLPYKAYDVESSGGVFTLTLPATPNIGDWIWLSDVSGYWDVNKVTLARNGQLIEKLAANQDLDVKYWSGFFVFIGGIYGWVSKQ